MKMSCSVLEKVEARRWRFAQDRCLWWGLWQARANLLHPIIKQGKDSGHCARKAEGRLLRARTQGGAAEGCSVRVSVQPCKRRQKRVRVRRLIELLAEGQ